MKFKASQIAEIVQSDIAQEPKLDEVDLESFLPGVLKKPMSKRFKNSREVGFRWLWIVWDGSYKDGYIVVYDPRKELFGLAIKSESNKYGSFIGFYGSFVESFRSI